MLAVQSMDSFGGGSGYVFKNGQLDNFSNTLTSGVSGISNLLLAILVVIIFIDCIGCIVGGENQKERFRNALPWILAGTAFVALAKVIAKAVGYVAI